MTEIRTNQRGPSQLHWQTHFLLAEKLGVWWRGGAVTANTLSTQAASVSCMCVYVLITQSCPTHCDPIDPDIKTRSPTLQTESLPSGPPGKLLLVKLGLIFPQIKVNPHHWTKSQQTENMNKCELWNWWWSSRESTRVLKDSLNISQYFYFLEKKSGYN